MKIDATKSPYSNYYSINKIVRSAILTNIYYTVICELPAGLQFQDAECAALFRTEVTKCSIGNVISLQREFIKTRQ